MNAPTEKPAATRLLSLDALRGFDMFWIVGAGWIVAALHRMGNNSVTSFFRTQMSHVRWDGLHFLDLIFPLFVFIMGVSTVLSLTKALAQGGRAQAVRRIAVRSLLLYLLGVYCYGGLSNEWPNIRLLGVLNRIAICYFFCGILFCYLRPRALLAVAVSLLVGYWAMMTFVPIRDYKFIPPEQMLESTYKKIRLQGGNPDKLADVDRRRLRNEAIQQASTEYFTTTDFVTGKFEEGRNLANHIDFLYLPGRNIRGTWDPEGLLSTIPAIGTGLLGVFAGLLLQLRDWNDRRKVYYLAGFGLGSLVLGWLWSFQFPLIKSVWTSSFVLVAGGYSALMLALFYWLVEVKNYRAWCQPFVWIGSNAITIYLVSELVDFRQIAMHFAGGDVSNWLNKHLTAGAGDMLVSLIAVGLVFTFMRFLYQRKIFLRL